MDSVYILALGLANASIFSGASTTDSVKKKICKKIYKKKVWIDLNNLNDAPMTIPW